MVHIFTKGLGGISWSPWSLSIQDLGLQQLVASDFAWNMEAFDDKGGTACCEEGCEEKFDGFT